MEDQDELQYIDKIVEILRVAKAAIPSAFVSSPLDDPAGIDYFYSILAGEQPILVLTCILL